jgi:hypothetical protein
MRIGVFFPTKEHGPLDETVERMANVAATAAARSTTLRRWSPEMRTSRS